MHLFTDLKDKPDLMRKAIEGQVRWWTHGHLDLAGVQCWFEVAMINTITAHKHRVGWAS